MDKIRKFGVAGIFFCGFVIILLAIQDQAYKSTLMPKYGNDPTLWGAFQNIFNSDLNIQGNLTQNLPPIYIITPTWPRPVQIAELTRLGYVLKVNKTRKIYEIAHATSCFQNVNNLIWIVAEDAKEPTKQVLELLDDLKIPHKYLLTPMPQKYRNLPSSLWPKGVANRNSAMKWIFDRVKKNGDFSGSFYFADDDNTYDIRLFEEIRTGTQTVSMFPVGFISKLFVSTPIVDFAGRFRGFYEGWKGNRTFTLDMAGFAVNVKYFVSKSERFYAQSNFTLMPFKKGFEEEGFLKIMQVPPNRVQFLASNCTKVYVWHTKTVNPTFYNFKDIPKEVDEKTNLGPLNKYWCLYLGNRPCGVRWKEKNKIQSK